jgi:succinoglycan biosynthesis transport protein ExoP
VSPRDYDKEPALKAPVAPVNRLATPNYSTGSAPTAAAPARNGLMVRPPAVTGSPDMKALLAALRRRWLLALCLGLVTAGVVGATAWLLIPTKYVAYATLQVAFAQDTPTGRGSYRNDFPIYLKTQASRLKSRDVLLKALSRDEVRNLNVIRAYPDTLSVLTWLEEYLRVEFQDSMELLTVSLPGEEPEELVVIVSAITNAYLAIINDRENSLRKDRIRKMEALEAATKEALSEKIAERQGLYHGQAPPDSAAEMQRHASLYAQKLDANREFWRLKAELEKLKGRVESYKSSQRLLTAVEVPESTINSLMQADVASRDKLASLARWRKNVDELVAAGHKPNDSTLVYARSRLEATQQEVNSVRERVRAEHAEALKRKLETDYVLGLEQLRNDLKPMEDQAKKMQDYVDLLAKETESVGVRNSKADLIQAEIKQQENKLETIATQLKNLQFEEEADPRVSACQEAVWQFKDVKRRLILMILIPLVTLIATGFGVAWWEFRSRKIQSADEVELGLGLRVVGAVPSIARAQRQRHFALAEHGHDPQVLESIDAIRTLLLHNANVEPTRLVMVTSAVSGEGKTTLASNLAISLARAGRRTLLVDGDLRRPALHQLCEQTLAPGFCEVLAGDVELPGAVRPTTTDANLWLLPAGHWDRQVPHELTKEATETVLNRLKTEFEFVIMDSHPVLAAADSLLLGQRADAVIVSLMRNLSRSPRVYAAYHRLATLGIRIVGVVVNGVSSEVDENADRQLQVA